MAKPENPWAAMDEGIATAAGVQQRLLAQDPYTLLTFAKQNNFHITDGYRPGKGHSPNSMHYHGNSTNPGAIDIDHKGVNLANLRKLAAERGYVVLDEVNHPSTYSTGPHYHIQKPRSGQAQPRAQIKDMLKPTASPVAVAPNGSTDLHLPLTQDIHGNILTRNQAPGVTGAQIEQYVQGNLPQPVKLEVPPPTPVDKDNPWAAMDAAIAEAEKPKPAPVAPAKQLNGFEQFGAGFQNALGGFTNDEQARQAQGFWGGAGNVLGTLGLVGGSGLAGAGLGTVIPGAGTVGGFGAGLLAGGTAAGGLQEAQRERLAGEQMNLLKIGGASAIGGLTSLPVGGAASTVGRTILKNAAIDAGVNTAGDVGLQMVEKGTIDPRQIDLGRATQAAALGAGAGGLGGLAHAKSLKLSDVPEVSEVPERSGFVRLNGEEILPGHNGPQYGFVRQGGEEINPRLTPEEAALIDVTSKPSGPTGKQVFNDKSGVPVEYEVESRGNDGSFMVWARDENGKIAGSATFAPGENGAMTAYDVFVDKSRRRQGIATKIYDIAERKTGGKVARSDTQTIEGKAFRDARDISGTEPERLRAAFQERTTKQVDILDPRNAPIPSEFGPVKTEPAANGLQIVTRADKPKTETPQIDIVRDPFYRAEPEAAPTTLPDLSKPAQADKTPLSKVVSESLSGDYPERDALLAYDTLTTLGYDVHEITKKRNTLSHGKQYSVTIGGKTVRFKEKQTLNGLMADHKIGGDTIAKGVNARGGKFNQERLMEMLPDSEAKQRFLSEQGAADIAARDAAEAANFAKAETDANELMARIDQAENMDHLGELFQEAMDPKYQDSPAFDEIFNKLEAVERRLTGNPDAPIRSTRDIGLRRAEEITGQTSTDMLSGKPGKSKVVQMPNRGRVDLLDAQGRPLRGEKPAQVDLLKPEPTAPRNPGELEIPNSFPSRARASEAPTPSGRYSPEIQKKLDEVDAVYNRQLQQLKEGKSLSGSVYLDSQVKGLGMERAAKKRQIIQGDSISKVEGGLTDYELGVLQKREATNYTGKAVLVDNRPAKVMNTSFGKVKVQFEDGSTRMVEPSAIQPKARDMLSPAEKPVASEPTSGIYRTPGGGEIYTHGRSTAEVQQQLQGIQGQLANIAEIERHLQTHNPEAVPAIRNILNAGKNSEVAKFSYVAREAPGEAARVRDNFVPTHFTYESIKPATQRSYLRRKFGSDEEVIAHLKQEIIDRGGSIDAAALQTKGGADIKAANQVTKLINALDAQTGGAYLKSPRVHGINLGETTRSAAGDRGIRLDTIVDSSLTGRKVTPELLAGHTYNNKIAETLNALDNLAQSSASPVFTRAVKQIQKGGVSRNTMRELKKALADKELGVQFCNIFGVAHD